MVDQGLKIPKYDPNRFKTKTSLSRVFETSYETIFKIPIEMSCGLIDEEKKQKLDSSSEFVLEKSSCSF